MTEPRLIFVNKKPFRIWSQQSTFKDQDMLLGLRPDLHVRLASDLVGMLGNEKERERAVLGIRLHYGLAQEAFFALLFATLQAPYAPTAWLLLYRNSDLLDLIKRFCDGKDFPSQFAPPQPGSWEALAVMLFPRSLMTDDGHRERARRLGSLWAEWAAEQLNKDMRDEFNGLKHSMRIRSAEPCVNLGGFQIEGDEHGSWFATSIKDQSDVILGICSRSWSAHTLYSRLKLMAASCRNLVAILKRIHRAGDTAKITIDLPEEDELDSATTSAKPLAGLRLGPSWEENRPAKKLTYEDAIIEYMKTAGTLWLDGKIE